MSLVQNDRAVPMGPLGLFEMLKLMQNPGCWEASMYGIIDRACIYVLYSIDTPGRG